MTQREEVNQHQEKLWVIALPEEFFSRPLTPLPETIDWYQNLLLTKCLLKKKVSLEFGEKTLIPGSDLTSVKKIVVVGLGAMSDLNGAQAKKFLKILSPCIDELKEEQPWIVLPSNLPTSFSDEVQKNKITYKNLSQSAVSVG